MCEEGLGTGSEFSVPGNLEIACVLIAMRDMQTEHTWNVVYLHQYLSSVKFPLFLINLTQK